jgi:hypothetical protein
MTLDDLKHIFRHQTTATDEYTPSDTLVYLLFEGQNRLEGKIAVDKMEDLVAMLDNFQFDGYRDRTPLFIKPDTNLG